MTSAPGITTTAGGAGPSISRSSVGRSAGHDGQPATGIERFELVAGPLRAVVLSAGARLTELWVPDRHGVPADVVVSQDPAFADYDGATIGRFANRIANGRFELDGVDFTLATNNGPNHLHGGKVGFDKYVWESDTIEAPDHVGVRFRLCSPAGDEGYPGSVDIEATYLLTEASALVMEYRATTDEPTVLNLTNHVYWNLAGGGPVDDHQLRLGSDHVLLVDEDLIPAGDPTPVAESPFDFRAIRSIDVANQQRYDHCFVLDREGPAAILSEDTSGRRLTVETTQPAVQLYTANHFDPPHIAVALETQGFPNAPNRPDFPSTALRPGEIYHHTTTYTFTSDA